MLQAAYCFDQAIASDPGCTTLGNMDETPVQLRMKIGRNEDNVIYTDYDLHIYYIHGFARSTGPSYVYMVEDILRLVALHRP